MSKSRKIVHRIDFALAFYGLGCGLGIAVASAFNPRHLAVVVGPAEIGLLVVFIGLVVSTLAHPKKSRAETSENKNG